MREASIALDAYIDESIRISQKHGYHPTTFIGMRRRHGTIEAMSRLVQSGDMQSGFKRMRELNLLNWTIEAAIGMFSDEFTRAERECAAFRLQLAEDGRGAP